MERALLWASAAAITAIVISCVPTRTVLDPTHCASNDGDAFCAAKYSDGSFPFCAYGTKSCDTENGITDPDVDGCLAERPRDECYSPCGGGRNAVEDSACDDIADGTMSGTTGPTSSTAPSTSDATMGPGPGSDTETETAGETTEGDGCEGDGDCTDAGAPFCDAAGMCVACDGMPDPDAACAGADAAAPVCNAGSCVQCTAGNAGACDGQTPVCDDSANTCRGCTEHAECPDSACHLDGGDVGACFAAGDVQNIANATALETALSGLGADDQAVLVLAAGTYGTSVDISSSAEVAILGSGSTVIAGDGGLNAVELIGTSITYFSGVEVANISGNGVSCSGTAIWLDDSEVRNNAQAGLDISGGVCGAPAAVGGAGERGWGD